MLRKLILLGFLSTWVLACGKSSPSIVGKWVDDSSNISFAFKADGTYINEQLRFRTTGKYKIDGQRLAVSEVKIFDTRKNTVKPGLDEVLYLSVSEDKLVLKAKLPLSKDDYYTLGEFKLVK